MSDKSNTPKLAEFKASADFKTEFGTIGCYIENFGEMLQAVDADYTETGKIKIPAGQFPSFLVALYDKVAESFDECEGRELVIDFGDNAAADTIETLVMLFISQFRNKNKTV